MYMQVRAPEENNMAITRHRLQQIIKEEVALLLREAEGDDSPTESLLGTVQKAVYDNTRKAAFNRIEADAARAKAAALEGDVGGVAQEYALEDEEGDLAPQVEELNSAAAGLEASADSAEASAARAKSSLEQVAGILGAGGAEAEEAPAEEEEAPEAETVTERWNRLAFGRRIL
jgi:hypothetical protein